MSRHTRRWAPVVSAALLLAAIAACTDRTTSAPAPSVAAPDASAALHLRCGVDVRALTVNCGPADLPGGPGVFADQHTFGGQGVYVNLVSSGVTYAGGTFSFNTTVQNASNLAMSTSDGATRDDNGMQIFINTGPTVTSGTGAITVANATGTGTFLSSNQSYYQYGGKIGGTDQTELGADGILSSAEVSTAKNWQFSVPATVTTFSFDVYVSTVTPPGTVFTIAPQVTGVSGTLVPGTSATITATNLNATPASNIVTIGGRAAAVTGGTATSLTVTVPCVASGAGVPLYVATGGVRGAVSRQPLLVTQRTVAVGDVLVLTTASDSYCNELTSAAGPARYIVSVFSASTVPSSNSPFQFSGDPSPGPTGLVSFGTPVVQASTAAPEAALRTVAAIDRDQQRRDAAHSRLLDQNTAAYTTLRAAFAHTPRRVSASRVPTTRTQLLTPPATRQFRVPNVVATVPNNQCNSYYVVDASLVYSSGKIAIYEDTATPAAFKSALNATMLTNYQKIGNQFNADIEPIIRNNFGDLLRRDAQTDNDGQVVALFTPRINTSFSGNAGFVVTCDQFPNDDASTPALGGPYTGSAGSTNGSSNFGEVFYGYQPLVAGTGYSGNTADNWYRTIRSTFVHELKHLASFAARVENNAPSFEAGWLEEGTARHAEELWEREAVDALAWKGNSPYGTFANPINVYCDVRPGVAECDANARRPASIMQKHFTSLYTNMFSTNARLLSPFGATPSDNALYYYASSWSLARYALDRYGVSDAAFLTALTQSTTSGVTNLTARAGVSIDQLLGGWATSFYADDYPGLASPSIDMQMPTWNFRSIYAGLNTDFPSTYTLTYPLIPQARTFGTFAPVGVTTMRGGGVLWYEITGTQALNQLIRLETNGGAFPSTSLRLAVARLQ
ncbi:MAG: IPT/TIG domain-containing protein [bacterium]